MMKRLEVSFFEGAHYAYKEEWRKTSMRKERSQWEYMHRTNDRISINNLYAIIEQCGKEKDEHYYVQMGLYDKGEMMELIEFRTPLGYVKYKLKSVEDERSFK